MDTKDVNFHSQVPGLDSIFFWGRAHRPPSRACLRLHSRAVVSRARKTTHINHCHLTAGIAQIPAVSSKEGAVIGAVLSTRKFHRGHH
jgi:hypothetical protein